MPNLIHRWTTREGIAVCQDDLNKNKAGYTAIQSRTVGQEQHCEKSSEFRNLTDGPTDTVRSRVAYPPLKKEQAARLCIVA